METNNTATEVANTEAVSTESKIEESNSQGKYYTAEDIAMIEQRAGDRRISQYQKTMESKIQAKIEEAKRVASMNEKDRYEYELSQREKAIQEKEHEIALIAMKNEASKILAEKGLSLSLVDLITNEDAETTHTNINLLEKAFKESVKLEVEKRLSSKVPMKSLPTQDQGLSKDQFKKLSVNDLMRLKEEQPEVWAEMTK